MAGDKIARGGRAAKPVGKRWSMFRTRRTDSEPRSILITGASSGIGAALARRYAKSGATLFLGGRDEVRLGAVATDCRAAGASAETASVEATNRTASARWIAAADEAAPLDLVIANAGISAGTGGAGEDAEQVRRIFAVNVEGVANTVLPALDRMLPRGHGQIAIMSSLAGLRGFPGAPAYAASKAAVRVWGESLRAHHARDGIRVSVVCPGFIATPMTAANRFRMPFLMDADRAADIIRRGLARDRGRIAFPCRLYASVLLLAALPGPLADPILRRLPRKD